MVFPNPAARYINFAIDNTFSEPRLLKGYTYNIVDQRGITVLSGELQEDLSVPQEVETGKLANGMYVIIISRGSRALVHRKIAVMNQH
jgi:hypothetical protein